MRKAIAILIVTGLLLTGGITLATGGQVNNSSQQLLVKKQTAAYKLDIKEKVSAIKAKRIVIRGLRKEVKENMTLLKDKLNTLKKSGLIDKNKANQIRQKVRILNEDKKEIVKIAKGIKTQMKDIRANKKQGKFSLVVSGLNNISISQDKLINSLKKLNNDITAEIDQL